MTEWNPADIDSFWGLTEDLRDAIGDWRAALEVSTSQSVNKDFPTEADFAALQVALCIGHCQLYQVGNDELLRSDDFPGDRPVKRIYWTACREVHRIIALLAEETNSTDGVLLDGSYPLEMQLTALDVLKSRLLFEGLRSLFHEWFREDGDAFRIDVYEQLLKSFDEEISSCQDELSVVCLTQWPRNVARTLPVSILRPRPWWLTPNCEMIYQNHQALLERLRQIAGTYQFTLNHFQEVRSKSDLNEGFLDGLTNSIADKVLTPPLVVPASSQQASNSLRPIDELQLSADNNVGARLSRIATFRHVEGRIKISSVLYLSQDYQSKRLVEIPNNVPITLDVWLQVIEVANQSDEIQTWRLRWLPLICDVELRRLSTQLASTHLDWRGTHNVAAGDLKSVARKGFWPAQYWRRIA